MNDQWVDPDGEPIPSDWTPAFRSRRQANIWEDGCGVRAAHCDLDRPTASRSPASLATITAVDATGKAQWALVLNDETPAGNMRLDRFDDAGKLINSPISAIRATGELDLNTPAFVSRDPIYDMEIVNKRYADSQPGVVRPAWATGRSTGRWRPTGPTGPQGPQGIQGPPGTGGGEPAMVRLARKARSAQTGPTGADRATGATGAPRATRARRGRQGRGGGEARAALRWPFPKHPLQRPSLAICGGTVRTAAANCTFSTRTAIRNNGWRRARAGQRLTRMSCRRRPRPRWAASRSTGRRSRRRATARSRLYSCRSATNKIINGDMRIDQRNNGASGTANRWLMRLIVGRLALHALR